MQVEIKPQHEPAIQEAISAGEYTTPAELIDDLLTRYETDRWAEANKDAILKMVAESEQTPAIDLTLDQLRQRMDQAIDRASA